MNKTYDPKSFEKRIYSKWLEKKYFSARFKRYILRNFNIFILTLFHYFVSPRT